MSNPRSFDFCVLGAGLAGMAMAKHLLLKGAKVALIDPNDIASGASGTPLGLVNPATGRFGTMAWEAESCLNAVTEDLQEVQEHSTSVFYKNTGILRPAQDVKMATRMEENVLTQNWPEGWCQWLEKDEILSINADLNCVKGGMWLPKGLTVNVSEYLNAKSAYLESKGLKVFTHNSYHIEQESSSYRLTLSDGSVLESESLVFTSGYDLHQSEYWKFLPLNPVKGQVAVFNSPLASTFDYSISALGYMASISKNRFVAGSTYEHHFEDRNPNKEGLDYLIKRLSKVYPLLFKNATLQQQWAGVRASTPNRKPLAGAHPENKNMYVLAGLGSKGMLYSEYLAAALTSLIYEQRVLPAEVSVNRV